MPHTPVVRNIKAKEFKQQEWNLITVQGRKCLLLSAITIFTVTFTFSIRRTCLIPSDLQLRTSILSDWRIRPQTEATWAWWGLNQHVSDYYSGTH